MHECGKHILHSKSERACAAHETTISNIKEIVEILNYEINDTRSTNRDMPHYIDIFIRI